MLLPRRIYKPSFWTILQTVATKRTETLQTIIFCHKYDEMIAIYHFLRRSLGRASQNHQVHQIYPGSG